MKPFFTFFGGKYRAAKRYPAPQYGTIVEPFAGSAGFSVRHYHPDIKVILNDLDETIAGTWEYLIQATSEEILSLPLYDGTWETLDDLNIPQEQKWLIGWHMNKGTSRPSKSPSKWMRTTDVLGENYWGPGLRARIARQVPLIKHWEIRHGSYEELPDIPATWFVDPPYMVAGKGYRMNNVDYKHLGQWSQQRSGQVIVCENAGADWLPFVPFGNIKGTSGAGRTGVSKEVIWTKGDELVSHLY